MYMSPALIRINTVIFYYQALRASLQATDIGDAHDIITLVLTKQVYNGRVKLLNEIEPVCLLVCFPFCSSF